jgi:amino acid transporter
MGRGPAILFTLCGFLMMNLVAIPGIQAGSRTVFSLARDDLLPFSSVLRRISKRTQTPIAAVWVYAVMEIIINLLGLASGTAISAVFNVCTVALNVSYVIPIACKILYGRFERGPWHLGKWSVTANLIAIGWNGFMAVIFFFPTNLPVTPENVSAPCLGISPTGNKGDFWSGAVLTSSDWQMNYAIVVFVFVMLFAIGFWYTHGRHFYTGPLTQSSSQAYEMPTRREV